MSGTGGWVCTRPIMHNVFIMPVALGMVIFLHLARIIWAIIRYKPIPWTRVSECRFEDQQNDTDWISLSVKTSVVVLVSFIAHVLDLLFGSNKHKSYIYNNYKWSGLLPQPRITQALFFQRLLYPFEIFNTIYFILSPVWNLKFFMMSSMTMVSGHFFCFDFLPFLRTVAHSRHAIDQNSTIRR